MTFFPSIDNYFKSNCVVISFSFLVQKFAYTLDLLVVPLEVTRTIKSKLSSKQSISLLSRPPNMNRTLTRKAGAQTDICLMAGCSVFETAFRIFIIFMKNKRGRGVGGCYCYNIFNHLHANTHDQPGCDEEYMCIGIYVYPKTESQSFHISDKTSCDLYLNVK